MWLVRNGVPFDTAFGIDDTMRAGLAIICSGFEGFDFDFGTMSFRERK